MTNSQIHVVRLSKLHPLVRPKIEAVFKEIEILGRDAPWKPSLGSTLRTPPEQIALWKRGRARRPSGGGWEQVGPIVTRAMPWQSAHCFGMAADIPIVDDETLHWVADDHEAWKILGEIVEKHGLEWGGRWKFRDAAHMQLKDWQDTVGILRIERMRDLILADGEVFRG